MKKKHALKDINTYLIALLLIVMGVSLYLTLSVPTPQAPAAPELLELRILVLGSDCNNCWNPQAALAFLAGQPSVNITSVENKTIAESEELAATYAVARYPAVLVLGETNNLTIDNFDKRQDALVFDQAPAPYYDVATKKTRGQVTLTVLSAPNCPDCFNLTQVLDQFKENGIAVTSQKTVPSQSEEGKALIARYAIERLPTLIMSNDSLEYPLISDIWAEVGTVENDGKLVLRSVYPPYVNVTSGKTEGLVDLTLITDEKCAECYNASILEELFAVGLNMKLRDAKTVDVTSARGKLLIKKYAIELVPTVVASSDANIYPVVAQVWNQIGTVEKDGALVARNIAVIERAIGAPISYRNLTSGDITMSSVPQEEAEISAPTVEE